MEFESTVSDVVRVVEAVGAMIMIAGGLGAFLVFLERVRKPERRPGSYPELRRNLGRSILLGPSPVARRTLAHEFGHLLGFDDGYVRAYEGDSRSTFGVVLVEWTGLSDDLMADSLGGHVTEAMIRALIDAYDNKAAD